jgi:hypothetical protein
MADLTDAPKRKSRAKPGYTIQELNGRPLLRPDEFAFLIGCSRRKVDYLTDRLFRGIRVGGTTWIDRIEALDALKNFRQGPRKSRKAKREAGI